MTRTIKDQRHVEVGRPNASEEEVKQAWQAISHKVVNPSLGQTFPNSDLAELTETNEAVAQAYINDNRWVADCPADECNSGMMVTPGHTQCACFDCGRIWQVEFPAVPEMGEAIVVLELRPEANRFWKPWEESAEDLRHENIQHGYPIP